MVHVLFFYRIILYSFGFGILITAGFKYITSHNRLVRAFLFFWISMTITAAGYVIDYYVIKNTDIGMYSYSYILMQVGALLISVSLPYFIHNIFNIKNKTAVLLFLVVCTPLLFCVLMPVFSDLLQLFVDIIMIMVLVSNAYSFLLSLFSIVRLRDKRSRIIGIVFIFIYTILFLLLIFIDIYPENKDGEFLIFPLFYAYTGIFFAVLGYNKFRQDTINCVPEECKHKYGLTEREAEIILLLIEGMQYKNIAERLFISLNTVNTHIRHIYDKTGTNSKLRLRKLIQNFQI